MRKTGAAMPADTESKSIGEASYIPIACSAGLLCFLDESAAESEPLATCSPTLVRVGGWQSILV